MQELKLSFLTKDTQLRQFLNNVLNKNFSKEDLQKMMEQKIKEEEEFLEQLKAFKQDQDTQTEIMKDY